MELIRQTEAGRHSTSDILPIKDSLDNLLAEAHTTKEDLLESYKQDHEKVDSAPQVQALQTVVPKQNTLAETLPAHPVRCDCSGTSVHCIISRLQAHVSVTL